MAYDTRWKRCGPLFAYWIDRLPMSGRMVVVRETEQVMPGVVVATSRTAMTTSTLVLDPDGAAVLVDPAWEPDELDGLAELTADRGWFVAAGLSTHAHHD